MEKRAGIAGFVAVTILLVLIAALFFGKTVMSRTDVNSQEMERYYLEKERELTGEVRMLLSQEGFENSGVTVTRVVEADGSRLYTVTIHHGGIDSMDDTGRAELLGRLRELNFADDRCRFVHQFLCD